MSPDINYYWAAKTQYLTEADRTVYIELKTVDYAGNFSAITTQPIRWKMTVGGEGDHLIQAGEKMIFSGPLTPPSLPAADMYLWTGGENDTPTYSGLVYSSTAPTNSVTEYTAEGHCWGKSVTMVRNNLWLHYSSGVPDIVHSIQMSAPVYTAIHVIKKREVQAVSYWEGDKLPNDNPHTLSEAAKALSQWGIIYARIFISDLFAEFGYTVHAPSDAKFILFRNPTAATYTTWAQYSIGKDADDPQRGTKAHPPLGAWGQYGSALLWWSPKLNKGGGDTLIPFYAKYHDTQKGIWLTLEWDKDDAEELATQKIQKWLKVSVHPWLKDRSRMAERKAAVITAERLDQLFKDANELFKDDDGTGEDTEVPIELVRVKDIFIKEFSSVTRNHNGGDDQALELKYFIIDETGEEEYVLDHEKSGNVLIVYEDKIGGGLSDVALGRMVLALNQLSGFVLAHEYGHLCGLYERRKEKEREFIMCNLSPKSLEELNARNKVSAGEAACYKRGPSYDEDFWLKGGQLP